MLIQKLLVLLVATFLVGLAITPGSGATSPGRYGDLTDASQEVDLGYPGGPATTIGAPEIDFTDAWFDENATEIGINWQVVDVTHNSSSDETFGYTTAFSCEGFDIMADADYYPPHFYGFPEGFSGNFIITHAGTPQYHVARLNITVEGNHVRGAMSRAWLSFNNTPLSCSTIAGEKVSSALGETVARNPLTGETLVWGGNWWHDRIPNGGSGPTFTLPSQ